MTAPEQTAAPAGFMNIYKPADYTDRKSVV